MYSTTLKNTWRGPCTKSQITGAHETRTPAANHPAFASRPPAWLQRIIQTNSTGTTEAVSKELAAAAPAKAPAAAAKRGAVRWTAAVAQMKAATISSRHRPYG